METLVELMAELARRGPSSGRPGAATGGAVFPLNPRLIPLAHIGRALSRPIGWRLVFKAAMLVSVVLVVVVGCVASRSCGGSAGSETGAEAGESSSLAATCELANAPATKRPGEARPRLAVANSWANPIIGLLVWPTKLASRQASCRLLAWLRRTGQLADPPSPILARSERARRQQTHRCSIEYKFVSANRPSCLIRFAP